MKRTLFLVAALVVFATGASAVTLTVVSDKTTYNIGETITLSVNGQSDPGQTSFGIFGRLEFDGSLVNISGNTQKLIGTAGSGWNKSTIETFDSNAAGTNTAGAETFDQVNGGGGTQTATDPISTVTLIAQAAGVVNVVWNTASGSGFELNFFGLSSGPGASFTIVAIPEPSTVALLGLGLIGLTVSGRRRS